MARLFIATLLLLVVVVWFCGAVVSNMSATPYNDIECYGTQDGWSFDGWEAMTEFERQYVVPTAPPLNVRWAETLQCRAFGPFGVRYFMARQLWIDRRRVNAGTNKTAE